MHQTHRERKTRLRFNRIAGTFVVTLAVIGLVFWLASAWRRLARDQAAMAEILAEIDNGRFGLAARSLGDFLARSPSSDEALYWLGFCEKERGRTEEASKAWASVPPTSRYAPKATAGRLEIEILRGRLADAEQLVRDALHDPRVDGSGLSILLGPVYCQESRLDEALRLIEARWEHLDEQGEGGSEKAVNLVRLHIELLSTPMPVEVMRGFLDQYAQKSPDDDRVWLGRANLAIRVGEIEEAERLLEECWARRPDDYPVWRARLNCGLATGSLDQVQAALGHLAAVESTPAQVQKLTAWFARKRKDVALERKALGRLIELDPLDLSAWDRLIELTAPPAEDLRRRKADFERMLARYQKLHRRNQPARDAEEMARLAGQLGRWFEAKVFLTLALAADPKRDDLRGDLVAVRQRTEVTKDIGRTLAGVLNSELDGTIEMEPFMTEPLPIRGGREPSQKRRVPPARPK
jgi:thioredoxin-like negative regulator of GroEL